MRKNRIVEETANGKAGVPNPYGCYFNGLRLWTSSQSDKGTTNCGNAIGRALNPNTLEDITSIDLTSFFLRAFALVSLKFPDFNVKEIAP